MSERFISERERERDVCRRDVTERDICENDVSERDKRERTRERNRETMLVFSTNQIICK